MSEQEKVFKTIKEYNDMYGIGVAFGSISAVFIIFIIAISCGGQWENLFEVFK